MRLLVILLVLTGCSPDWGKPGATSAERYADLTECAKKRDAYMFTQPEEKIEIFSRCMTAKGWQRG